MFNIINKFNVTRGGKPRSKALPGIIKISENHLVVAYRDASVHPVGKHKKIDDGVILAQQKILIEKFDTIFSLYEKCFHTSTEVVLAALNKLRNSDMSPIQNNEPSYFSFPNAKDWQLFRELGGRFI